MALLKLFLLFVLKFYYSLAILDDSSYIFKEGKLMIGFVDNYSTKIKPHQMQNILTFQRTVETYAKPIFG
ncbi:hypothetical protein ACHWQZ_G002062, partial [Mnemiopsis leidyi]